MLRIKPFAALRPAPRPSGLASEVACVPYDVINAQEARTLAEGKPSSFLHVIRSEIDLPPDTDPHADIVYQTAVLNFQRFQAQGILEREPAECIYLYRQEADLRGRRVSQTGVVACCHIDDYANNIIKKHEKTRKEKEDDRTRHMIELRANPEPVFFLFRDRPDIKSAIAADASRPPLYDFVDCNSVRHTVWKCGSPAPYVDAFRKLPEAYVADGHHRTASAARAGAHFRSTNHGHTGNEEYNWFLTVLFPASELTILPYHRIVRDLAGLSPEQFLERLASVGTVEPTSQPDPPAPGVFTVYLGKARGWHRVTIPGSSIDRTDPIRSLDYELIADRVLTPILGVGDLRLDKRIDFVGGIRGWPELEKRVDLGEAAVAFCMHPVTIEQLMAIADAGHIMPPKSTWFEPKLRSGLLVHTLD